MGVAQLLCHKVGVLNQQRCQKERKKVGTYILSSSHMATPDSDSLTKFRTILADLADDFSTTFPEYAHLWQPWTSSQLLDDDHLRAVFDHCLEIFPAHFFDILNKNTAIFDQGALFFLPKVDFSVLFHCQGISEHTRNAMWNYLQLLLFNVIGSVQDKAKFGAAESAFANVNEAELLDKLKETIQAMSTFFESPSTDPGPGSGPASDETTGPGSEAGSESGAGARAGAAVPPNPDDLFGHLRGLFDGKIGSLAKEMAEEIANDLSGVFGDDFENVSSTQEVFEKLMKDPKKMMNLIGSIKDKLQEKLKSGAVSQDEIMKEVEAIFGKMDGANDPKMQQFASMLSKLTGKDVSKLMRRFGQGMGMDAEERPQTVFQGQGVRTGPVGVSDNVKEKMKERISKKKAAQMAAALQEEERRKAAEKAYVPYVFDEDDDVAPAPKKGAKKGTHGVIKNNTFSIPGGDKQPVSQSKKK